MLCTWAKQIPSCACKLLRYPPRPPWYTLGNVLSVAGSGWRFPHLTPDAQWHAIWRTLANPGE